MLFMKYLRNLNTWFVDVKLAKFKKRLDRVGFKKR